MIGGLRCWALLALTVDAPAFAGELGRADAPAIPWGRVVLAFLFCIAFAIGAIMLLRRYRGQDRWTLGLPSRQARQRAIEVVETRRVSQHGDACLLQCRGRDYLFIITPHGVTLLDPPRDQAA